MPEKPLRPSDSLVQTTLGRGSMTTRKLIILIALGLIFLLVSGGAIYGVTMIDARNQSYAAAHVTATPTTGYHFTFVATYTPEPLPTPGPATATVGKGGLVPPPPPYPQPGWASAGPTYTTAIAFAPGDPLVGYACGPQTPLTYGDSAGARTVPFVRGRTSDGGKTWQANGTFPAFASCRVSVSPTNAQYVAVLLNPCELCAPGSPQSLWRSQDGGQNWVEAHLPLDGTVTPDGFEMLVWVGTTIFAQRHLLGQPAGQSAPHTIAASVGGGAFAWVDGAIGASQQGYVGILSALGPACLVAVYTPAPTPSQAPTVQYLRSSDNGNSWQTVAPFQVDQHALNLRLASVDGKTLLANSGYNPTDPTYRSRDGGQTWQALPLTPTYQVGISQLVLASDGTIYATAQAITAYDPNVYRLRPGSQAWEIVGQIASSIGLVTVQTDASGRLIALWADGGRDGYSNRRQGMQTHAP